MARSRTANTTARKLAKPAAKASQVANLDGIANALVNGDAAVALVNALATWRTARDPALADLIDTLSNRIAFPPTRVIAAIDRRRKMPLEASKHGRNFLRK